MFGLFKNRRIPVRGHRTAPLSLADGKNIVASATWDQAPIPLNTMCDGDKATGLTTPADESTNTAVVYIEIELDDEYEIYEIKTFNAIGTGFKKAAAGANQEVQLVTQDRSGSGIIRDTQLLSADGNWHDTTLSYIGNGVPAKKILVSTIMNTAHKFELDLSEIEVYGN